MIRLRAAFPVLAVLSALAVAGGAPPAAHGQDPLPCPRRSGADAEAGWQAYQAGDMDGADARFRAALGACPEDRYAQTGLGYVLLRMGDVDGAVGLFEAVVAAQPDNVDAWVGLGLAAWRQGELDAVRSHFLEVQARVPDHPTAADYLARLPEGVGPPPERREFVLPASLRYPARVNGDRFEIRTPEGWRPFYIKGVNLGAALPGKHPSQFPDSATYAEWIASMVEMNANVVRVYTIHPPHFYEALREWNTRNPDRRLWLIHGVWTELPHDHDYRGAEFEGAFFDEMRRVVDLLHGRADIPPRPGHASGFYTADVSPWVLAYIIGREWEPYSAIAYDSIRGGESGFQGRYIHLEGGNAMDVWLARAMEEMTAYEVQTYRAQRPIAYTNWPTLDPLDHPTESTVDEEMAIRIALGETPKVRPREYDNDGLALDAALMRPTPDFPAGTFASFHAYPYYPDFMVVQPEYLNARSSLGASNYFGYLQELKAHHPDQPVVISEYGVPASLGTGHLQPQGWHHGGLTEEEMAAINVRLTRELAESGMAGGAIFAWIDEWFKKNWVVIDFEIPLERNRLWFNRMDAEQHYGMWAMDPRPAVEGATLNGRLPVWRGQVAPLIENTDFVLRAAADPAYLWLLVETPGREAGDTLYVGLDMIRPDAGDFRWPGGWGEPLPAGIEFALRDDGAEVRLLVDPPSNPFRLEEVGQGAEGLEGVRIPIGSPLPGTFHARVEQRYNLPYYTIPNRDGRFDSLKVVVNRRRFTRDSTEILAAGYDRGVLPAGPAPDGFWERGEGGRVLEVRIPWSLVNVTDPSTRTVLQGPGDANVGRNAERGPDGRWRLRPGVTAWPDSLFGELGSERIDDIGLMVGLRSSSGTTRQAPAEGAARWSWPTWDEPEWVARRRPVFDALRDLYAELDPYAGATPEPIAAATAQSVDSADAAWMAGDVERARTLYARRLAADSTDGTALHRMGLMLAWDGSYTESLRLLEALAVVQPDNLDARVDAARVTAWSGDLDSALDRLDALLEEHPGNVAALEARALFQAWAGEFDASLSTYEELLGLSPGNTEARRRQAQVLSWASDFDASRAVLDSLLTADPGDVDARLALGRVLAFSDDLDGSEEQYRIVLRDDPDNVRALQGLGQAQGWGGKLVASEATYRRAVAVDGTDVSTLVGLAQTLRWQGRNAAALDVLERARALDPASGDVREQIRWVRAALAPRARPSVVVENDSDDNHMVSTSVTAQFHPTPRLGLRADLYRRDLSQRTLQRSAWGMNLTASWQFEPGWTLFGGVGGSRNDGTGTSSFEHWRGALSSPGRYPAGATVTFASYALDATAVLAERGVRLREVNLDGRWTPVPGWRLNGGLGTATVEGAERNERRNATVSATRLIRRGTTLWTLGIGGRTFGFEKNLTDGYFDPDFYGIAEVNLGWLHEPGRWGLLLEASPGVQQVGSEGEAAGALRLSARVAYQVAPGREISVAGGYSSAGLQSFSTGAADYRYTALIFGASWVF